jgi:hypothetical protein
MPRQQITSTGTLYHKRDINSIQNQNLFKKGAGFMQLEKAERKINNAQSSRFTKRIGSTVYTVNIFPKEDSKETLEAKMFRMMQSDLTNERFHGNIIMPQADALPERGSV